MKTLAKRSAHCF